MTSQGVGSVSPHFLVSDRHYDLFHLFVLNHTLIATAFVRKFTKCFWVSLLLHIFKVQFNFGPETPYPNWGFSLFILNFFRHIVVVPHIRPCPCPSISYSIQLSCYLLTVMYCVLLYIFSHVVITADKKGGTMLIVTEMNMYHCQKEIHIMRDKVPFHRKFDYY